MIENGAGGQVSRSIFYNPHRKVKNSNPEKTGRGSPISIKRLIEV